VGTIVVGVDGSDRSVDALRWAIDEARLRHDRVLAVHAWQPPVVPPVDPGLATPPPVYLPELIAQAEAAAKALIERVVAGLGVSEPDVEPAAIEGPAAQVLVDLSADADLVVVASRGLGGLRGLLLGSVGRQVAEHAACPVVIHRAHVSPRTARSETG
jgi:nucleotide-binding universal stress UspA family protein